MTCELFTASTLCLDDAWNCFTTKPVLPTRQTDVMMTVEKLCMQCDMGAVNQFFGNASILYRGVSRLRQADKYICMPHFTYFGICSAIWMQMLSCGRYWYLTS